MKARFGEEHATSRTDAIDVDTVFYGRVGRLFDGVCVAGGIDRHGVHIDCVGKQQKFLTGSSLSTSMLTSPVGIR